jgi:hypothetical protein
MKMDAREENMKKRICLSMMEDSVLKEKTKENKRIRPVRLAYQSPASSTFLSHKPTTSNQSAVLFSQNKLALSHPEISNFRM